MNNGNKKLQRNALASSLAIVLGMTFTAYVSAQEATAPTEEKKEENSAEAKKKIATVQVVGSRIKRSEVEGPSPVTILTSDDLEKEGHATVADALNTLTQVTGDAQNELTQNGFTPNATVLNLRGLGPGRVLTLVNGRRVAEYPRPYNSQSNFVNIGSIPSAAVERIEVLSGGASAVYGSDAVAGVVNVVLKKSYDGQIITLLYGEPTRGGAGTTNFKYVGGAGGDNWNLVWAAEYFKRDEIFASERDFMDSYRDDPTNPNPTSVEGLRLRNRSLNAIAGYSRRILPAGYNIDDVCGQFAAFETYDSSVVGNGVGPSAGKSCAMWGYPATQVIRNSDDNKSGYLFGTYTFDNGMEFYGNLSIYDAKAYAASNTQFISNGTMFSGLAATDVFYDPSLPSGAPAYLDFQRIFTPEETAGQGGTEFKERTLDITVGLRGDLTDSLAWDFGLSTSRYNSDTSRSRLLRTPTIEFFGDYQGNFSNGRPIYQIDYSKFLRPLTPQEFASISTIAKSQAESKSDQASFVVTGDLMEMQAGSLGFAGVLELARQSYSLNPDPRTLPGNNEIINLSDTIGGGDRNRYAVGAEISVPWTETLKSNFAARMDKYDDASSISNAFTWNTGLEWRPTSNFLARGSYGTTFRAPDMHYIYAGESGFFTTIIDEYNCRLDGTDYRQCGDTGEYAYSVAGLRRGDATLKQETGKTWTAGFVWDVLENMNFSVDYYSIALEGGIADDFDKLLSTEASCRLGEDRKGNPVDANSAECLDALSRVTRSANPVTGLQTPTLINVRPRNVAFEKTTGVDATLTIRQNTERLGSFRYNLAWSHVFSLEYQPFADDPITDYRDDLRYFNYRSRTRGTVSWSKDDWSAAFFMNRLGSLPNWGETGRISPMFYYNTTVNYRVNENFQVGLRVNNILDKIAPKDDTFNSYPFFWRGYSPIGREVWLQLDYRFGN
jgi:outer membrane receptor protein involved in Fe transport